MIGVVLMFQSPLVPLSKERSMFLDPTLLSPYPPGSVNQLKRKMYEFASQAVTIVFDDHASPVIADP